MPNDLQKSSQVTSTGNSYIMYFCIRMQSMHADNVLPAWPRTFTLYSIYTACTARITSADAQPARGGLFSNRMPSTAWTKTKSDSESAHCKTSLAPRRFEPTRPASIHLCWEADIDCTEPRHHRRAPKQKTMLLC